MSAETIQREGLTPIDRVRLALAMSDAGYCWQPDYEDVAELLQAYDTLAHGKQTDQ